jgi:hypothetical protein
LGHSHCRGRKSNIANTFLNTGELPYVHLNSHYHFSIIFSITLSSAIFAGRAAIQAGMESDADGSINGATLDASAFNARDLGNGYIMANGSWEQRDAKGTRVDGGLWGNLFQVVDGEVLMVLESTNRN